MSKRRHKSRTAGEPQRDSAAPRAWRPDDVVWWLTQAAGAILLVYVARLWLHVSTAPVSVYDEGIVLTHSFMVANGYWPHRDFYANYPPGTWLTVNAAWSLFGQTVPVARALGAAVHLVIAALAGRLVARIVGRRLALLPAAVCALWLTNVAPVPYAWMQALGLALLTIEIACVAADRQHPAWWALCGVVAASVSFFRHDLFAYFFVSATVALAIRAWLRRADLPLPMLRAAAVPFAAALLATLGVLWTPVMLVGGAGQVLDDIYFDMVRYVMPCRQLPMPSLAAWDADGPAMLSRSFELGVALVLAAPVLAALALFLLRRAPPAASPLPVLLLGALSLAVIPQMTGRTDHMHVIYAVTPGLMLLFVVVTQLRPWPVATAALLLATLLLVRPMQPALQRAFVPLVRAATTDMRLRDIPYDPIRRQAVADVRSRTQPDERIYVGMVTHRFTVASEMDLYFLAERAGGVRRMQFDPCLANQEKSQRETIAELERNRVRVALLSHNFAEVREPSGHWREGSDVLDTYLRERFRKVAEFGPYEVWERRL